MSSSRLKHHREIAFKIQITTKNGDERQEKLYFLGAAHETPTSFSWSFQKQILWRKMNQTATQFLAIFIPVFFMEKASGYLLEREFAGLSLPAGTFCCQLPVL